MMTHNAPTTNGRVATDSYTRTLRIQASPHAVYNAVTTVPGLKGWWSDDTVASGDDITVRFGGANFQTLRLADPTPDRRVVREWIAQYFPVEGTSQTDEWVGTWVKFAIEANSRRLVHVDLHARRAHAAGRVLRAVRRRMDPLPGELDGVPGERNRHTVRRKRLTRPGRRT